MNHTNLPLLDYFKKYLLAKTSSAEKLNPSSVNNYVSDIKLFLNWASRTLQQNEINAGNITPAIIKAYQAYLSPGLNETTLKRHLSSLRRFGFFLVATNRLNENPTKALETSATIQPAETSWEQLVERYVQFLKREQLAVSSIKNYLSDLNAYFSWLKIDQKNIKITDNHLN